MRGIDSLGGGLIDLIGQLEIVAFTGGRGIGAVGSLAWTAWGLRRRWLDGQRRYHGWWDGRVATDCAIWHHQMAGERCKHWFLLGGIALGKNGRCGIGLLAVGIGLMGLRLHRHCIGGLKCTRVT